MDTDALAAHIAARVPHMAAWPAGRIAAWWTWHWRNGLAAMLREDGRIVGLGCARSTDRAHLGDEYHHDPAGDVLYVGLAIAEHPEALRGLFLCMRARIGPRPTVAYHRDGVRLHIVPFERYERLLNNRPNHLSRFAPSNGANAGGVVLV